MAVTTYIGFKPYAHQRAVINELTDAKGTGKVVTVCSSRQKGKSMMVANLLLYYAINFSKTRNFCVSPTLKQSKAIYQVIVDAVTNKGLLRRSNATDLELQLINGSLIIFRSAEQREALRGYTADFLAIDECCFITDDIFYTILPWVDARKAPILMTSTPFVKDGFFWKFYNYGLDHTNSTITIDWSAPEFKADIEKILPPEKLEEYRRVMPKNQFKSEYLGQWLDDEGQVFTGFRDCVMNNHIVDSDSLYVGIDWGSGVDNDDTVISIVNGLGNQVLLSYWNNLSTTEQIDAIYETIQPYEKQIVLMEPELNSIGKPMTDLLMKRLQPQTRNRVNGVNTTNQSKAEQVAALQVAFEQRKITLLDDDRQMRELSVYAAEYNPRTKNIYYNAPAGLHDDMVIALMLAWDAYQGKQATGGYCTGTARMNKARRIYGV